MKKYQYIIHTDNKQIEVVQEFDCELNKVADHIRKYINQDVMWLAFEQFNGRTIYINTKKIIAFEVCKEASPTT